MSPLTESTIYAITRGLATHNCMQNTFSQDLIPLEEEMVLSVVCTFVGASVKEVVYYKSKDLVPPEYQAIIAIASMAIASAVESQIVKKRLDWAYNNIPPFAEKEILFIHSIEAPFYAYILWIALATLSGSLSTSS